MVYLHQQNFKSFVLTFTLLSISSFCSSLADIIMTQSLTNCHTNDSNSVVFEFNSTYPNIQIGGKQWYLFLNLKSKLMNET